jgi:hypothetical protein
MPLIGGAGDDLINRSSWDALRLTCPSDNPFFVYADRHGWQAAAEKNKGLARWAGRLAQHIRARGYSSVVSCGVGGAHLEYWLKHLLPEVDIYCSDYAPQTVERLRQVFPEAREITVFDMLNGAWNVVPGKTLYLMHRVDAELDDAQWPYIFRKMHQAGVKDIVFVPCGLLTPWIYLKNILKPLLYRLIGRRLVFSGYLRTEHAFRSIFQEHYRLEEVFSDADFKAFVLSAK